MEPITIGQRVRVIAARLVHYRQVGTVTALHANEGYYVHLDYDDDLPNSGIFFHREELEAAPDALLRQSPLPDWSGNADTHRRVESGG